MYTLYAPVTGNPPPPTPGRRGAYVGVCKCFDELPAPRGWGIVHFRQFIF